MMKREREAGDRERRAQGRGPGRQILRRYCLWMPSLQDAAFFGHQGWRQADVGEFSCYFLRRVFVGVLCQLC